MYEAGQSAHFPMSTATTWLTFLNQKNGMPIMQHLRNQAFISVEAQ